MIERADQRLPRLRRFITLRHERFGALLFNPYLAEEERLDPVEAWAAALCTGEHAWSQIEAATAARFGLQLGEARQRIEVAERKLDRLAALTRAAGEPRAEVRLPALPAFAPDGPALCAPRSVIWDVTYACNLRCPHCLTASGKARADELDTAGALRLLARLAEAQILYLSLSGGEPLLRPDVLELIARASDAGMRVDVATNGVALPDRVRRGLRELPLFQVQVSIDGIGASHDRFRGRAGAFEASCRTLRELRDDGMAVSISTTATAENLHEIDRIIDLALELGCRGFKAIPFIPAGRGRRHEERLRLSPEQHAALDRLLARRSEELSGRMAITTEGGFTFLGAPPPAPGSDGPMGCAAGHDTLSVGADGTAYPCPFFHDFPLGNLLEVPLRRLWIEAPPLRALRGLSKADFEEPCRSCRFAPALCHGGCRAAAWLTHGRMLAQDPSCYQ